MATATVTPNVETTRKTRKTSKAKKAAKVISIRGHEYELTAKGRSLKTDDFKDQQLFILRYFKAHGSKARVADVAAAAAKDKKGFPCTQPHKRAVAYYFTEWKRLGLLRKLA